MITFPVRFTKKFTVADNGCWLWHAAKTTRGYGTFFAPTADHPKRLQMAHRFAYEYAYGPIPPLPNGRPAPLDHFVCDTYACVNPDHVRPSTHRENILRGNSLGARRARQTHCKRGHEFTPENTYTSRKNERRCRACHRDEMRTAYRARKAA